MENNSKFQFHPETGDVRLGSGQLVFRLKRRGVEVWDKHTRGQGGLNGDYR